MRMIRKQVTYSFYAWSLRVKGWEARWAQIRSLKCAMSGFRWNLHDIHDCWIGKRVKSCNGCRSSPRYSQRRGRWMVRMKNRRNNTILASTIHALNQSSVGGKASRYRMPCSDDESGICPRHPLESLGIIVLVAIYPISTFRNHPNTAQLLSWPSIEHASDATICTYRKAGVSSLLNR